MLTFRAIDSYYNDPDYDGCGNIAIAVVEWQGGKIALCGECVQSLAEDIKQFQNTIFCKDCKHFGASRSGFQYGGTCLAKCIKEVNPEDYSHIQCVSCMDTCKAAERK